MLSLKFFSFELAARYLFDGTSSRKVNWLCKVCDKGSSKKTHGEVGIRASDVGAVPRGWSNDHFGNVILRGQVKILPMRKWGEGKAWDFPRDFHLRDEKSITTTTTTTTKRSWSIWSSSGGTAVEQQLPSAVSDGTAWIGGDCRSVVEDFFFCLLLLLLLFLVKIFFFAPPFLFGLLLEASCLFSSFTVAVKKCLPHAGTTCIIINLGTGGGGLPIGGKFD